MCLVNLTDLNDLKHCKQKLLLSEEGYPEHQKELTASNTYERSRESCWRDIKMRSVLPEPVEGGTAAVPRQLLLLCISHLWAIQHNTLVLSVTVICVSACIWEIFTFFIWCPINSIDMFVAFFPNAEGQSDHKKWVFFFPSCICATEVAVSHLWPIHLELTLSAETFGGCKQCWKLLGESLFVYAFVFFSMERSVLDPLDTAHYKK